LWHNHSIGKKSANKQAIKMLLKHNIITFSLYLFVTLLVVNLMHEPSQALIIWPAVGIGICTALVWGIRVLPALYLAQLALSFILYHKTSESISFSEFAIFNAFIAVGLFRCYFGAFLIKYIVGYPNSFVALRPILIVFLFIGPITTLSSAFLYDIVKYLLGFVESISYSRNIFDWWFGDYLGFVIFLPITLTLIAQPKSIWKPRIITAALPTLLVTLFVIFLYNSAQKNETQRVAEQFSIKNDIFVTKINLQLQWIEKLTDGMLYHFLPKKNTAEQLMTFLHSLENSDNGADIIAWSMDGKLHYIFTSSTLSKEDSQKIQTFNLKRFLSSINDNDNPNKNTWYLKEINKLITVINYKKNGFELTAAIFHDLSPIVSELQKKFRFENTHIALNINTQSDSIVLNPNKERVSKSIQALTSNLNFLSEAWRITITPTQKYIIVHRSELSSLIAKIGFLFSGLIGLMLLIITGKNTLTEIQVKERTLEIDSKSTDLRNRKKQYQELIEQHPVILWRQDVESHKMTYISDKVEALYGYSMDSWLNEENFWLNIIYENDRQYVQDTINQALQSRKTFELEYRIIKSDFTIAWVKDVVNINYHTDIDSGTSTLLVGLMIDITEAKEAKEKQSISESKYRILFKQATDPLIILNLDDNSFKESNDKAIALFGLNNISGHVTLADFSPLKQPDGSQSKKRLLKIFSELNSKGTLCFEWVMLNSKHREIICQIDVVKLPRQNFNIALANINDITEKRLHEKKINQLAYYDNLTKLPNREYFYSKFEYFHELAINQKKYGTIIYLDLDRFKILNDSLGHQAGDKLLTMVGERIRKVTKKNDFCARLGGDEFIILTKKFENSIESALETSLVKSELILEALNEPYQLGDYEHLITPSIGISLFPSGDTSTDQIIHQADIAMYASKAKGKNTITIYQANMVKLVGERLIIEKAIRQAFEFNEFELYYQPQIKDENKVYSVEALLRWKRSAEFNINTEDLIDTIEQIGLTHELGHWVFDNACAQLERWNQQGHSIESIAINVSAKQFHQKLFSDQIKSIIESYNLKPSQIVIELTEAVIIEDMVTLIQKLNELKEYGIRTSLDDFGTGYSSLAYLKHLPIDQLKIDKMFVHDLFFDDRSKHIVKTIIDLAKALQIDLIAEGIEVYPQYELLRDLGCINFQGFYFSKPKPAHEIESVLDVIKVNP